MSKAGVQLCMCIVLLSACASSHDANFYWVEAGAHGVSFYTGLTGAYPEKNTYDINSAAILSSTQNRLRLANTYGSSSELQSDLSKQGKLVKVVDNLATQSVGKGYVIPYSGFDQGLNYFLIGYGNKVGSTSAAVKPVWKKLKIQNRTPR